MLPWEAVLAVIVVTRLRLRDPALLDEFFTAAAAALEQAKRSAGSLGSDVLADAANTWWTVTSGRALRRATRAFVAAEPHRDTMSRLDGWCDEATFADWEQDSADLPGWQECWQRIVADGQVAGLSHATPANATRDFPAPVEAPAA